MVTNVVIGIDHHLVAVVMVAVMVAVTVINPPTDQDMVMIKEVDVTEEVVDVMITTSKEVDHLILTPRPTESMRTPSSLVTYLTMSNGTN